MLIYFDLFSQTVQFPFYPFWNLASLESEKASETELLTPVMKQNVGWYSKGELLFSVLMFTLLSRGGLNLSQQKTKTEMWW